MLFVRTQPDLHSYSQVFEFLVLFPFDRAFPYDQDPPPGSQEGVVISSISLLVRLEFFTPECLPRRRHGGVLADFVDMPERTVNEDDRTEARQHEIGRTRQVPVVQPISQPEPMKRTPKPHLRTGVALPHAGHDPRSRFSVDRIHSNPFHRFRRDEGIEMSVEFVGQVSASDQDTQFHVSLHRRRAQVGAGDERQFAVGYGAFRMHRSYRGAGALVPGSSVPHIDIGRRNRRFHRLDRVHRDLSASLGRGFEQNAHSYPPAGRILQRPHDRAHLVGHEAHDEQAIACRVDNLAENLFRVSKGDWNVLQERFLGPWNSEISDLTPRRQSNANRPGSYGEAIALLAKRNASSVLSSFSRTAVPSRSRWRTS
jgi:hypothetical protein